MLSFAPVLIVQSSLRPRFDPREGNMGCVVDKKALGQVFLKVLSFALSVSFHHCSIHTHSTIAHFHLHAALKMDKWAKTVNLSEIFVTFGQNSACTLKLNSSGEQTRNTELQNRRLGHFT